ncbi:MAG: S41 family peptidase [Longimicrobiales bacterium]
MTTQMLRRIQFCAVLTALIATTPVHTNAQGVEGYYRYPTVSGNTIVFTAEGDLWRVDRNGGAATRLTTHRSDESRAQFSPDGKSIAFSAAYEGPTEVYTMPVDGGLPRRLTYDGGAANVIGWTPDNQVLYATNKFSTLPAAQLAQVDARTGSRRLLPLAQASDGAITDDGTLVFTRFAFQGSNVRGYRGGTAQQLWKYDTKARTEATPLTTAYTGTSKTPMINRGRIYFASDRGNGTEKDPKPGVMNIWSTDMTGGDITQVTHHTDYDVAFPSMAPDGKLVYQQGADIWYVDVDAGGPDARMVPRKVRITLATDLEQMREQWITTPMQYFGGAHLSPNGDRVLITSLGHVWVAPVGQGRLALATPQPKDRFIRFRGARFQSDGKSMIALSDESGEVELWKTSTNGIGERTQLTNDGAIVRWDAIPSPDGKRIAHHDRNNKLWIYEVTSKSSKVVATSMTQSNWITSGSGFFDIAWSPDGRYIAFGDVASNMVGRIAIYDNDTGATTFATTDRYNSYSPAWSPDGKWLFFLSDRNFVNSVGSPWGLGAPDPYFDNQTKIYAVALQKSPPKWPFVQKTELDAAAVDTAKKATPTDTDKNASPAADSGKKSNTEASKQVVIDTDGIATRLFELPVPAGNYGSLSYDGTRLYWQASIAGTPRRNPLMQLEFKNEAKPDVYLDDVATYELSQDRKKILIQRGTNLYVTDAGAKGPSAIADKQIDLAGWTFPVNPVAMRRQMFEDAWRLERDYYHDPKMNGVDWKSMREKYRPLAARVTTRAELSDVLAQMVAELSTLHTSVGGGDLRRADDNVSPASLGARLDRDEAAGGFRVVHIYQNDPDIPNDRSPLAAPDVNIREGDVIVSINGISALTASPEELLRNQAGKQVLFAVKPAGTGAVRQVIVTPWAQGRDGGARYGEWEYTRRLMADSLSGGKVGYLHLRAMGSGDAAQFARDYFPVFNKQGLIIDVRNNNGGNIDSWILGRLMRKAWSYWQPRVGDPYHNMQYAFNGPMVMIVNERTSSDGEAIAEGFRRLALGKIIGTRTWGGEIWLSRDNVLVDGGVASAAQQGLYGMSDRKLLIEGWGVEPDIVVDNLPSETFSGRDRQLEAAVRELLVRRN